MLGASKRHKGRQDAGKTQDQDMLSEQTDRRVKKTPPGGRPGVHWFNTAAGKPEWK